MNVKDFGARLNVSVKRAASQWSELALLANNSPASPFLRLEGGLEGCFMDFNTDNTIALH